MEQNTHSIVDPAEFERCKEYEYRYQQLLEVYVDPIIIYQDMRIVFMNEVAEEVLGGSRDQFIGEPIDKFIHPDYRDIVLSRLQKMMATRVRTELTEIQVYNLQQELLDVEVASTLITYNGAPAVLTTLRNITERKKAQQEVVYMAYHDDLTGLPNRRKIHQELSRWIEKSRQDASSFAVIMLDVDRFKFINDSLGHQYGDFLLIEISKRIQNFLTKCGCRFLFGRLGGDEFVILLEGCENKDALSAILGQMEDDLRRPFYLKGEIYYTTSSIGVAIYPHDGTAAEELLRNSDLAMYERKKKGKDGHCFFSHDVAQRLQTQIELESDLRRSLEHGELELYYQPQFNAETGDMIGVEALIRWHHPTRGVMPASEFIPLAEETGLILDIGKWVVAEACKEIKAWHDRGGPQIPVWVNLSSLQFQQPNLAGEIEEILREVGLHPKYLGIEITESIMMDAVVTEKTLEKLHRLGVQISLDDFGTGYSSLSYLQRFAIHKLKIDRSFIKNISNNKNDQAIVSTIINMAKNLNLGVVAEGIETEDQLAFLTHAGCSNIQGYYFGHPLPLDEIDRMYGAQQYAHESGVMESGA